MTEYVNTGLMRFEYLDFPFLGPESLRAAEAASCAMDQDKYWPYHDTIFLNQKGENSGAYSDERLIDMARVNDLDVEAFTTCLENDTYKDQIEAERQTGVEAGVGSTPTLFLNGEMMPYRGWEDLKAAIDAALAAAN